MWVVEWSGECIRTRVREQGVTSSVRYSVYTCVCVCAYAFVLAQRHVREDRCCVCVCMYERVYVRCVWCCVLWG